LDGVRSREAHLAAYTVELVSFEVMEAIRREAGAELSWNCLFSLPFWLQAVCRHLVCRNPVAPVAQTILAVSAQGRPAGIVPLIVVGDTACFLGSDHVCDYQDIAAVPGHEGEVMEAVCRYLVSRGIRRLSLRSLRPNALTLSALRQLGAGMPRAIRFSLNPEAVAYETDLLCDWEAYLQRLEPKQRHEVRRKLRRLENSGTIGFSLAGGDISVETAADVFIDLFRRNRRDKAEFMTDDMAGYFRELIDGAASAGFLKLFLLGIDHSPAAAVLCFDYQGVRYLYNNSYDAAYQALSVGVLAKVFTIRAGIETGCRTYDFLKGAEMYKKHLGGSPVQLYHCEVELAAAF